MKGYDLYVIYKESEALIKGKKPRPLTEESYNKRISKKNRELWTYSGLVFETKFQRICPMTYMICGFGLYKTFNIDKMLRENIIEEYIRRDRISKRNVIEDLDKIRSDMKFIGRPLIEYSKENTGFSKIIVRDYVMNNIGPSILVYCIYKKMVEITSEEWDMLSIIRNNYDNIEHNVIKMAMSIHSIDKNNSLHQQS